MLEWFTGTIAGKFISTFFISMLPVVELRLGLPYGIALGLDYPLALTAAVLGNMLPVPFIILFIRQIFAWMRRHMPKLDGLVIRMEKKAEKNRAAVEKYAFWGLVILVAIPLPGTGAWTGALVAALLDMRMRKAVPSILLGVLIAAGIMTAITFGVIHIAG